jgi:hypothetical protein
MRAIMKSEYRAAPDGHTVVLYKPGEVVTGMAALWAIAAGHADELPDEPLENKVDGPSEVKDEAPRRGRKARAD